MTNDERIAILAKRAAELETQRAEQPRAGMSKGKDKTCLHLRIRCQVLEQLKEALEAIKDIENDFNLHVEIEVTNYLPVIDRHRVEPLRNPPAPPSIVENYF